MTLKPDLLPYRDTYTAPDGWYCEWETYCPMCEKLLRCRHDCGHPASFKVYRQDGTRQYHISGLLIVKDIQRFLDGFKGEHREQQLKLQL